MSLATLFQTGWAVFRRSPVIWLFVLIAFVFGALNHFIDLGGNQVLIIANILVVWLVGLYAETGTIYAAGRSLQSQAAGFGPAQRVIGSSLPRVVVLALILVIINPVLPSMLIATILIAQPAGSDPSGALSLINVIFFCISLLIYPFVLYCYSGVILHNGSLLGSLRRGWRIYTRSIRISLLVALVFMVVELVLRSAATGILMLFPNLFPAGHNIAQIIGGNLFVALEYLLKSNAGEIASLVFFTLLLDPLKRIMLANIYLRALGEVPAQAQPAVEATSQA